MNFHLTDEEESLRESVAEFVRTELAPLESEFAYAPDIFEGSRWKSRVKSSADPEVRRYLEIMEGLEKLDFTRRAVASRRAQSLWRHGSQQRRHDRGYRGVGEKFDPVRVRQSCLEHFIQLPRRPDQ